MKKLQILTLLIVLAFSFSVLAQEKENEKTKEAEKVKEIEKLKESEKPKTIWSGPRITRSRPLYFPPVANVTDVEIVVSENNQDESEENICLPSKILEKPGDVTTSVHNPIDAPLTYSYTVSGGKVIGQGKKVFWDLSGVKPGTYTITAAVDDGCGFCGMTKTKTIIVRK